MYSRVFVNNGQLYKETPLVIEEPYVFYEHENETYLTKPGKVYVEPWHPEFNYYLQMDAIATHYSLNKPFAGAALSFKDESLMSIRFNASKEAYMYKGYSTKDESNKTPVATMYINELDDTLLIHHEDDDNAFNKVVKHMSLEKDTSAVVETKPGAIENGKLYIDGVLYYAADYDYVIHNGYTNTTLQGDPWTNSNVTKLHE